MQFCVCDKKRRLWWNSTAAMFVDYADRTTFTDYTTAKVVAKEHGGHVGNFTQDAVRVCEYQDLDGRRSIFDIVESVPTNTGKIPPIIVDAIERALGRGNVVDVEVAHYEGGE